MTNSQDSVNFKKIKKVLDFVWDNPYSSFYKDKYTKAGINLLKDINSLEDFKKLPYLTKDELITSDPFNRFFLPLDKFNLFNVTGGTSGQERVVFLRSNLASGKKNLAKKALELGVKRCMFVHSAVFYHALTRIPEVRHRSIKRFLGNVYDMVLTAKLIADLKIDALSTVPYYLNYLIPDLEEKYDLSKIKYVSLGGESISSLRLGYYQKKFPKAYFHLKYASTEAGGIGRKCQILGKASPQVFHPIPHFYFETINPDKESELVLTRLNAQTEFPLIRYKTGDRVEITGDDCSCGSSRKMKLFGRLGTDVVEAGGIYIYPEIIDEVVVFFIKYLDISDWRLNIVEAKLKLEVILKKNFSNVKKVKDLIKGKLSQVFGGSFTDIEVVFVPSIEYRPPKAKRIICHE